ncbi:fungal specific transcription factor [Verticillium dahliae]
MAGETIPAATGVDPALRSAATSSTVTPPDGITEAAAAAAAAALSAGYRAAPVYQQPSRDGTPASHASEDEHDHEHEHEHEHDRDRDHDHDHDHDHHSQQNADETKRPRACEACRGLKVRCVPDAAAPEGPCARCRKARRACIVTVPTRKRAKKTDSRVAELEKKIDALTASLHARTAGEMSINAGGGGAMATPDTGLRREPSAVPAAVGEAEPPRLYTPRAERGATAGVKRKLGDRDAAVPLLEAARPGPPPIRIDTSYDDVIDRGILSLEQAAALFARYNDKLVGHLPAVLFPPSMTVGELRTTKPVLFLAVLAAASSETSALQRQLVRETMQVLAEKVVITGEKSLELVQALQLTTIWYWPPEHYEELKFYQLVHMAAVMAIDIGLGKRSAAPQGLTPYGVYGVYAYRHAQHRRTQLPDPQSLEARRAWLACYYLSSNTAMALHRPLLIRWTKFMADSMDILRTSPDAAPTDKYFCGLVDTHRVSEDVAAQFATAEPEDTINVRDPGITFSLRRLMRDLDTSYNMLSPDLHRTTLIISYHVVKIYMHEMIINVCSSPAARTNHPAEISLQDIAATSPLSGLHPLHVNAYAACLSSCHAIFDTFLATDIATLRCLPVFNLVRISYALVVLIKIFFCAVAPGSELAGIMGRDDMKVHIYVNKILEHFRAAAADDGSRPASKFLVVLVMLRSWFLKQERQVGSAMPGGPSKESSSSSSAAAAAHPNSADDPKRFVANGNQPFETLDQQQQQQQRQQTAQLTANTPLHLLSEIATNDRHHVPSTDNTPTPLSTGTSSANVNGNAHMAWPPPSAAQPPYIYDPGSGSDPGPTSTSTAAPPYPPQDFGPPYPDPIHNLSFEELAYSLGITGSVNFPIQLWPPAFSSSLGPHADTSMAEDPASAEACVRYALAVDPWVGQFGDVLDGVRAGGAGGGAGGPAGGGTGGSGAWAGPAQQFQM